MSAVVIFYAMNPEFGSGNFLMSQSTGKDERRIAKSEFDI